MTGLLDDFSHEPRSAYFSREIARRSAVHIDSGGLGVLAGDTRFFDRHRVMRGYATEADIR